MFFPTLERVRSIGRRHRGKVYTPEGFTHLLRMQFRDPGLRFYTERNKTVKPGSWTIKGEYRPFDDEDGLPSIHITFVYPHRERRCLIDDYEWDNIGFQIADIITHEYIHQHFCRERGFKYGRGYRKQGLGNYRESMQDYLGCEDEILAHAFNVASESVVYDREIERTRTYKLYKKHFRHDPYIVLKLHKQAVKYIKQLERPYEQTSPRSRNCK